ncbi:ParB/RepB/Spo0J family partition protein [Brackiella oedipodis]|uniref:ParB/RepB/Spo0J family partition protein n=1 Tax=Brackiella oedipodis TaxID=124225 RepID=UPI000490B48D|nr:ParB/RepB/Spo0J family partition protein [Brackiella oedipodis]
MKKGLGRGLDGLLGKDIDFSASLQQKNKTETQDDQQKPRMLGLHQLQAGKYQPRHHMEQEALQELAASIKTEGVVQPLLVRPLNKAEKEKDVKYEIIAGERRFVASQLAGLKEVPVVIFEVNDEKAAIIALIENMQREDLNPLEEAKGVQRLINEFNYTHEQAAQAIGRSRATTTNILRLLNLAEPVQVMMAQNKLSMGQGRALLALTSAEQIIAANKIVSQALSVREAEKLINRMKNAREGVIKSKPSTATKNGDTLRLERAIADYLGTQVEIKVNKKQQGSLVINFHNWDQLNYILKKQGLSDIIES